ncbi:hypothetical protein B0H14DRAFT_3033585, partial [Mycena olivaceomarginata]
MTLSIALNSIVCAVFVLFLLGSTRGRRRKIPRYRPLLTARIGVRAPPPFLYAPARARAFPQYLRTTKYSLSLLKNRRFGPTCEFDLVNEAT